MTVKKKDESPEEKNSGDSHLDCRKGINQKRMRLIKIKNLDREDQYLLAEVNFKTPFFGSIIYADISKNGFQEIDLPREFPLIAKKEALGEKFGFIL